MRGPWQPTPTMCPRASPWQPTPSALHYHLANSGYKAPAKQYGCLCILDGYDVIDVSELKLIAQQENEVWIRDLRCHIIAQLRDRSSAESALRNPLAISGYQLPEHQLCTLAEVVSRHDILILLISPTPYKPASVGIMACASRSSRPKSDTPPCHVELGSQGNVIPSRGIVSLSTSVLSPGLDLAASLITELDSESQEGQQLTQTGIPDSDAHTSTTT